MTEPTPPPGAPHKTASTFSMPTVERVRAFYRPLCGVARSHFGGSLGGQLLLVDGLAREGDALLTAASIAGAASLALEMRAEAVRHCVRNGIVDFAVNTLDEALRVLKNEIRKKQPIVVLLQQETTSALAAMAERGAQPDLLRWLDADSTVAILRERGAVCVPEPENTAADATEDVQWSAGDGGSGVLRQLDQLAAQLIPPGDAERQHWIARGPRYLSRALRLQRMVRMDAGETAAFLAAVGERAEQGTLVRQVTVTAAGRAHNFAVKS